MPEQACCRPVAGCSGACGYLYQGSWLVRTGQARNRRNSIRGRRARLPAPDFPAAASPPAHWPPDGLLIYGKPDLISVVSMSPHLKQSACFSRNHRRHCARWSSQVSPQAAVAAAALPHTSAAGITNPGGPSLFRPGQPPRNVDALTVACCGKNPHPAVSAQ